MGVILDGGSHYDAVQGGNPLAQLVGNVATGFSQPRNREAVKTLAVGWINDMFAGTGDGIYATPGETIQISASAGTATGVALPDSVHQISPFDALPVAIVNSIFTAFGGSDPGPDPGPTAAPLNRRGFHASLRVLRSGRSVGRVSAIAPGFGFGGWDTTEAAHEALLAAFRQRSRR